eukprot:5360157-Prymnesium_polylepis.2
MTAKGIGLLEGVERVKDISLDRGWTSRASMTACAAHSPQLEGPVLPLLVRSALLGSGAPSGRRYLDHASADALACAGSSLFSVP